MDQELMDAVMEMRASDVIDLALSSVSVRADLNCESPALWDAWSSLATKLQELQAQAKKLEALDGMT